MPAAVALPDVLAELDGLLDPARFEDYGPNGLQVPGRAEVTTVATGVSAHAELFDLAVANQADLLVVHHGLFWGSTPAPIDAALKRRLQLLFDADMSLAAYHLPLDAHPEVGNNALLARALGADPAADGAAPLVPFAVHRGQPIGCLARLPAPGIPAAELFARVREVTSRDPLVFDAGPAQIRTVAIVTGAGADHLPEAIAAGADAFVTGEPAERAMAIAREGAVHFVAAGHHATETFGVRRLGEHLSERFGVRHVFLDVPNPI